MDSMPNHQRSWVETFAEHGITIDPTLPCLREGEKALETCKWICARYQVSWSESKCADFVEEKRIRFRSFSGTGLFPQIEIILASCEQQEIPMAMVTGSTVVNARKVLTDSLWSRFTACVTAEDVQNGKPHPEPYLRAASAMGVDPKDCLVIENAPFGIRSARAAGCFVLALTTTLSPDHLSEADRVIESHEEILEFISEDRPWTT